MLSPFLLLLAMLGARDAVAKESRFAAAPAVAGRIDAFLEAHWREQGIQPAAAADDTAFLRRLTLDLVGRIPTYREAVAFAEDRAPDKRARAIRRLMESPEYALHLGRVLDEAIQGKFAGDPEFLEYLRAAVAARTPWDQVFREILLGPWDTKERKRADRFLLKRLTSLDDLTNDTARVFFGVNVSCAKCHDHPLVPDWTQDHYYGMASFFNPTYEASKGKGRRAAEAGIQEKQTAEVVYTTTKGERRTARVMFLTSKVLDEAAARSAARREQLVRVALEEKSFFSRAIVNRLWAYFLGRGLVQPVDQLHSANPPSVPGVLEWLAEDLAAHGYDLDRLVAALVSSRVYQLASTADPDDTPVDRHFDRAALRPLTPAQYALSMVLATGEGEYTPARYRELEGQAARLTQLNLLDPRGERYQSSTGEALFTSNHPEVQKLVQPAGKNLAARLAAQADAGAAIDLAVWTLLSRPAAADERAYLASWLQRQPDRARGCSQLVWALMTSAEFRFLH